MAARFPFARILVANVSASPDHDLLRYGVSLAAFGGAVETVSKSDLGSVLDAVCRSRADLLLLRDPQRWPEGRLLARRMVDQSPCSVWMVPVGAQPTLRRVVVDVGARTAEAPALRLACALGRCVGAEALVAVRVTQSAGAAATTRSLNRDRELEGIVARLDSGAMHCSVRVDHSHYISRSLRRAAEEHRADLLVVSAPSDTSRPWPYTRSDANELVGGAPTAILSVHASAGRPSLRDRVRRLFSESPAMH